MFDGGSSCDTVLTQKLIPLGRVSKTVLPRTLPTHCTTTVPPSMFSPANETDLAGRPWGELDDDGLIERRDVQCRKHDSRAAGLVRRPDEVIRAGFRL